MSKTRLFLKYWLPVMIWMVVIFSASADTKSYQHSSRIIGPVLHWLFPQMSEHTVQFITFLARKCAHLTEYAVLALLFWRARRKPVRSDTRPWSWREVGMAVLFVAFYASTDEFHQRFVPTRDPEIHDVVIDTTGAAVGMLFLWLLFRWLRRRRADNPLPSQARQSLP